MSKDTTCKRWETLGTPQQYRGKYFGAPKSRPSRGQRLLQWTTKKEVSLSKNDLRLESAALDRLISDSRYILAIQLDEEEFLPYLESTWRRATDYLRRFLLKADMSGHDIPLPRITPATNGGIDLLWELRHQGLMLTIPGDGDYITFYGRNQKAQIGGVLYTDEPLDETIRWLIE